MTTRAVVLVLLVCLHLAVAFQVPTRRFHHNRDLNEFRIPRARQFVRYMNTTIDPCVDFYEFACGNWQEDNPPSEDQPIRSPLENLQERVHKEVQLLLEESVTRDDGTVGRRVKDFYASCMDVEKADGSIRQVFMEFVKQYGGMPAVDRNWNERNYSWLEQVSTLRMKFGMDIIIGMEIKPDIQVQRDNRIYIGEPSTLTPKSLCKENDINNSQYQDLQKEVIDNMAYWFDVGEIWSKKLAIEIFEFETNLCRGMLADEAPEVGTSYPRKSLGELNRQFGNTDFQTYVTTSLRQPVPQTVYMTSEDYYTHLPNVIRNTSRSVLANYIMYRALATMSFPEEDDLSKRTRPCIEQSMMYFPKVIGDMYSRKNIRTETVDDIGFMWKQLKDTFKINIDSQQWIDETTRRQAIYKLDRIQIKFPRYPKDVLQREYDPLKIDKGLFWRNIQNLLELEQKREVAKLYFDGGGRKWDTDIDAADMNVAYSPLQNIIQMSWGLLQPPVYHRTAPVAYKYGVMGFLIAHELVHGFDEIGWNYDEKPTMRFWWDVNSTLLYKEQVQCFKEQYKSNVGEEGNVPEAELNEQIREIIADNGGLNISFHAYLSWLEDSRDPNIWYDETLSDVDYTNTQLFFLAFAQNFCTATYDENNNSPIGFFPWDVPNRVEKFEVNGPLMNMKEFAREFNCMPGSEMNPADKCVIY